MEVPSRDCAIELTGGRLLQEMSERPHHRSLLNALSMMESALEILDDADAPGHIGAHLDLAAARLREYLASTESIEKIPRIGSGSR